MKKPNVLLSTETIQRRVTELGAQITEEYRDAQQLMVVPILKGSFLFAADLIRAIDLDLSVEFLGLRSYGSGTETSASCRPTGRFI